MNRYIEELKLSGIIDFTYPYLLMVSKRNKDGDGTANRNRNFYKTIINSWEQIESKIKEYNNVEGIRFYLTINGRDELKAYKLFKKNLCDLDDQLFSGDENTRFDMKNRWYSCLAKSPCKNKFWFLDLDEKVKLKECQKIFDETGINLEHTIPTKNGYHLIYNPCDDRVLRARLSEVIDVDIKRDDYTLVGWN